MNMRYIQMGILYLKQAAQGIIYVDLVQQHPVLNDYDIHPNF
jgi:hypothetical protein